MKDIKTKHTNKTKKAGQAKNKSYSLARRLTLSLIIGGMFITTTANAMPTGGNVITNNGTIGNVTNNVLDVTGSGSSANVVIKWQDFGIKVGETVNFSNMNAVLNYVTGNNKSEIFGKLNGSGVNVFLINPNGVLFGAGAEVSVGSLYVSTGKMTDNDLNNFNGTTPTIDLTKVTADVVNLGTIKADKLTIQGGNITLGNTTNITKSNGTALTSGDKANYLLQSDGAINVGYEVVRNATIDVGDGKGNHTVANYGTGTAASGHDKGSDIFTGQKLIGSAANTINDYMLVTDVYDLQNISTKLDGKYMLAGKIDASATANWNSYEDGGTTKYKGFDPLGEKDPYDYTDSSSFRGIFDGLDYTITGITIDRGSEQNIGLFGHVRDGKIQNVGLLDGSITGNAFVGSIAGYNKGGTVTNVYNTGSVSSTGDRTGGIVGEQSNNGTLSNAYNTGSVNGEGSFIGGVVGSNGSGCTVNNVYNKGSVSGTGYAGYVGGVAGYSGATATISNAYNTGSVNGKENYIGGVVGQIAEGGTVSNVYNTGKVIGTGESVGGVVGATLEATISNAYNMGSVSGTKAVGGVAGYAYKGSMSNVYNTGAVTATGYDVGGVVGHLRDGGKVTNAYNTGSVTGNGSTVGGVVGASYNNSTVNNSYYAVFDDSDAISGTIVTGYKKHGDTVKTLTQAEFNAAFKAELTSADDQNAWKVYGDDVSPLLKYWLKPITVTGNNDNGTYTYNGTAQTFGKNNLTYSGEVDESLIFVGSQTNAGSYDLSDVLYSDQNGYDITVDSGVKKFEIGKADITIAANGGQITYGQAKNDFDFSVGAVSGLVEADKDKNLSDLYGYKAGNVTYTTDAWVSDGKTNNANSTGYDITIAGTNGMELGNYNINVDNNSPNKIVVNKATLTVTAEGNKELTYGSVTGPGYTHTVSGFVNGDTAGNVTISGDAVYSSGGWDDTNKKTGNAGKYDIEVTDVSGLSSQNYAFTIGDTTKGGLTINKAILTVTANGNKNLTYGATIGPTYTYTISGWVNGDTVDKVTINGINSAFSSDGWDSINNKTNNAGKYDINVNVSNLSSTNYDFTGVAATEGLTINKANLIAVADKAEIFMGDTLPQLTGRLEGLVYDDTADKFGGLGFTTDADTGLAGSYGITGELGNNDWQTNYTFTNAEGNATAFVVKAASDDRKEAALRYLLHVKHNAERECAGKEEAVTQAAVLAVEGTGVRQH